MILLIVDIMMVHIALAVGSGDIFYPTELTYGACSSQGFLRSKECTVPLGWVGPAW